MAIGGYYMNGYWWILMAIGGYYMNGYWWILMAIGGYYINGYCIISYCWLLYVILQLLVIIVL